MTEPEGMSSWKAVFLIRNILVQIRILDPLIIPKITDPVPDPALFLSGFQDAKENKKNSYILLISY